jgi:hypothetical protein
MDGDFSHDCPSKNVSSSEGAFEPTGKALDDSANLIEIMEGPAGDTDGDGDVDLADLATLLAAYDGCVGDSKYNAAADYDARGCVDLSDLAVLLANCEP